MLLVQGATDIQVSTDNLDLLKQAEPDVDTLVVNRMNHMLKEVPADRLKNMETYYDPDLLLAKGVVKEIVDFIKN